MKNLTDDQIEELFQKSIQSSNEALEKYRKMNEEGNLQSKLRNEEWKNSPEYLSRIERLQKIKKSFYEQKEDLDET